MPVPMGALHLSWLVPMLLLSGALGMPYLRDEVPFESVERSHFDALAVSRAHANAPAGTPLVLRVQLLGDGAAADLSRAYAWLAAHANVHVMESPDGAPLFITYGDLAATSGRATLGATVRTGMAVEFSDDALAGCVAAHEILHFLGLRHVDDPKNIMYPHCSRGQLDQATLEPWQTEKLDSLETVQATTPRGVQTWASRLS